jgi:hypothetical protein
MLSNELVGTILALVEFVKDESKPIKERRAALAHVVQLKADTGAGSVETIPEGDLAHVGRLMAPWQDRESAAFFTLSGWVDGSTLAQARAFAEAARFKANAGDESRSMADRLEAARKWRATLDPRHLALSFPEHETPERLAHHPHSERLIALQKIITNKDPIAQGQVDKYISEAIAALTAFRALRDEYPKRSEGVPRLFEPEQSIAYRAKVADAGRGRDTYSHVLRLAGFKV